MSRELASLRQELSTESFVLESARYQELFEQKAQAVLESKKKDSEIQSLQQQLVHKDRELQRKKAFDPEARCRVRLLAIHKSSNIRGLCSDFAFGKSKETVVRVSILVAGFSGIAGCAETNNGITAAALTCRASPA